MAESDTEKLSAPFLGIFAVAGYPKLSEFRDGLQLFLRHFLPRGAEKEGLDKEELMKKITIAEITLTSGNKKNYYFSRNGFFINKFAEVK